MGLDMHTVQLAAGQEDAKICFKGHNAVGR